VGHFKIPKSKIVSKVIGKIFKDVEIDLDALQYESCTFNCCRLLFTGTTRVHLVNCTFTDCGIGYRGPAENTLNCLSVLYQSSDERGKGVIEMFLAGIRQGYPPHSEDLAQLGLKKAPAE
jgi:hypothetical protein